jgi:hypothetical protein
MNRIESNSTLTASTDFTTRFLYEKQIILIIFTSLPYAYLPSLNSILYVVPFPLLSWIGISSWICSIRYSYSTLSTFSVFFLLPPLQIVIHHQSDNTIYVWIVGWWSGYMYMCSCDCVCVGFVCVCVCICVCVCVFVCVWEREWSEWVSIV